ncbi:energy-coupling factor transporter transmembrane protein EcfT [Veillonella sp. R32]|uniref:energy-coupling factor transporter transmembrane component T family protein n=1 Tax=Veillonella sp. R32 TaxID=2021312 RepID=UPI001389ABE9|nr:energy-coupling factor transporter transmembrane component T [Veillonella sp. R32]KAF1682643.1 cobalt transporter [Veillonella sp. R32]
MKRLVPFTKILMTIAFSVWAVLFQTPYELTLLLALELIILLVTGLLGKQIKAVLVLAIFAVFLAVVQYLGGGTLDSAYVTGLRMLCMTMVFIMLLATTKLQDLTAALVTQCKIPYEYAFMFTAALRFVPDFIAESKAVQEAQACRGLALEGNIFKRFASYGSVIQPLLLKSLGRSETMALSLELRGFGNKDHSFVATVGMRSLDYVIVAVLVLLTAAIIMYVRGAF